MKYAICTVAAAPVRKEPAHRAEMTNQLLFGEVMQIGEEKDEWFQIKSLYDHYEGWLTHHLITGVEAAVAEAPLQYVATALTNPVTSINELINAPMGASLTGLDEETRLLWNHQYKYHGTYRTVPATYSNDLLLRLIQQWLNAPYLWGGRTFMGVDCSGFVQVVFKVLGIPLLRDASLQITQGNEVENIAAAQTGDVAFFANEQGRIVHVGIVLHGNKIAHASGKVRIDALTEQGIIHADTGRQTHRLAAIKRFV